MAGIFVDFFTDIVYLSFHVFIPFSLLAMGRDFIFASVDFRLANFQFIDYHISLNYLRFSPPAVVQRAGIFIPINTTDNIFTNLALVKLL